MMKDDITVLKKNVDVLTEENSNLRAKLKRSEEESKNKINTLKTKVDRLEQTIKEKDAVIRGLESDILLLKRTANRPSSSAPRTPVRTAKLSTEAKPDDANGVVTTATSKPSLQVAKPKSLPIVKRVPPAGRRLTTPTKSKDSPAVAPSASGSPPKPSVPAPRLSVKSTTAISTAVNGGAFKKIGASRVPSKSTSSAVDPPKKSPLLNKLHVNRKTLNAQPSNTTAKKVGEQSSVGSTVKVAAPKPNAKAKSGQSGSGDRVNTEAVEVFRENNAAKKIQRQWKKHKTQDETNAPLQMADVESGGAQANNHREEIDAKLLFIREKRAAKVIQKGWKDYKAVSELDGTLRAHEIRTQQLNKLNDELTKQAALNQNV